MNYYFLLNYHKVFRKDFVLNASFGGSRMRNRFISDEMRADFKKYGEGRSFEDFVPYWSSAELRDDGRCYRRTNPNAKWDWWVI